MLNQPISTLKGIGAAREEAFNKLSVFTLLDLIYFLPRSYDDYSNLGYSNLVKHGELTVLKLKIIKAPKVIRVRAGLSMVTVTGADDEGEIQLVWYNQPYRMRQVKSGDEYYFSGRVDCTRGIKLVNPSITNDLPGILPVYPLAKGLTQANVRNTMRLALNQGLENIAEKLPLSLREKHCLCDIQGALKNAHFPIDDEALQYSLKRLTFEDMLYYILAMELRKLEHSARDGIVFNVNGTYSEYINTLPFTPTKAQLKAMREIECSMGSEAPMNRLLQGDVGSGKTAIAFYALYIATKNGYQAVLMAPTELLAQQHYSLLKHQYGDSAGLLSGGLKQFEKSALYTKIANGEVKIIVGTHAIIQECVEFQNLGIVVTDEQHRFGVRQRAALINKAQYTPDVLVLSATPIPRTLAMLFYGDLELSILDEMPEGRKSVITRIVPENKRADMYGFIEREINKGRQCYVVCPLVEKSDLVDCKSVEEVFETVKANLPLLNTEILHGRMKADKKNQLLGNFRLGKIDILVSTTVIEVGIDIKNATVMVIEDADRFGLAQLHQLRGRVCRGSYQSFCFLLSYSQGTQVQERLNIMVKSNDGFVIAQKDLELRGPGEFWGTRQHGSDDMKAIHLANDMSTLLLAQKTAKEICDDMHNSDYIEIFKEAEKIYTDKMRDIANN